MDFFPRMGGVLAVVLLLCGVEARAQQFTNGGFEVVSGAPIPPNSSKILDVGDTWLTGWSAGGANGTVVVQNGIVGIQVGDELYGMGPWQGNQWVIFPNDTLGGSLSQTFATAVGAYCSVSFFSGYVYSDDDGFLEATVEASNGAVLTNNVYELSYREWTGFQMSFIATTPTTTLTFSDASMEAEGADIGLDDVGLVTEPPGWPYIITSPESQTNASGSQVTFGASAGGNPSSVQWYLGTNAVMNATNTMLTVIASGATAGSYTAVFSNGVGTNVSLPADLTVLEIVASPVSQTVGAGTFVTFSASANLSHVTNQWYFGPYPIPGATGPTLSVTADNQTAGSYSVQSGIENATVTSATATLTVLNIPFINGSFEETSGTSIAPGDYQVGNVGETWLTGWAFGGTTNEVFVFDGSFLGVSPAQGNQWVVFDSEDAPPPGVLFQTFSTTVGQSYVVTFSAVDVYYYNGNLPKSLTLTATASNGSVLASNTVSPSANWSANQLAFTAQTINTTLAFTDTSAPNVGPSVGLDDVTVNLAGALLTAVLPQTVSGSFVVSLAGQSGQSYIVQTSTNLMAWSPVSTNTLSGGTVNITNAVTPGAPGQFWRAVEAP